MPCSRVWIELDEDYGYLLEQPDGFFSYERRGAWVVPAFSTPENAALFARQQGLVVEASLGGHRELAALVAFAEGVQALAPEGALDDWILLDEIAFAAKRADDLASPHDHVDDLRPEAAPEAREAARAAVKETLDVARAVLVFLDAGPRD